MNRVIEKTKRVLDVVEYCIEHGGFPSGEEVKRLAEEHGVPKRTIYEDIRKAREGELGDKVMEVLRIRLRDAVNDVEGWRNSDLIKLYQATRPKQTESKINLKAEIDIKGEAVADVLKEYAGILKRETILKKRDSED